MFLHLIRTLHVLVLCFLLLMCWRPLFIQGQMLTLAEYILLLYRALLPIPVWYKFFLNKEYGSLFSSLTTGLYLTFKLTSLVEKVIPPVWTFILSSGFLNSPQKSTDFMIWFWRSNPYLLHWEPCHIRRCIMGLMPRLNRSVGLIWVKRLLIALSVSSLWKLIIRITSMMNIDFPIHHIWTIS